SARSSPGCASRSSRGSTCRSSACGARSTSTWASGRPRSPATSSGSCCSWRERDMKTRRLGRTGLMVSEIGFGAWGIGKGMWVGAEDEESLRALGRAVELGVDFIDTALAYGPGHSERLVGRLVRERKETLYVATKVPPKNSTWPAARGVPASEVFPAAYLARCAEE